MGPLPEEGYEPEKWQSANGAGNVPPAFTPVSRRVAPCAVFGEGVAVVTTGREIRLVGANPDRGSKGYQNSAGSGSKSVQVKGFMLLSQPKPGKHRPAKPCGRTKVHTFSGGTDIFYTWFREKEAIQGIFAERK